jgi:hypothetical protein
MITKYDIIDEVSSTLGMTHEDERKRLERLLNRILANVSEEYSFLNLRRTMKVDLGDGSTEDGERGVWMPSNLAGIDGVQDDTTGEWFTRREQSEVHNVERLRPRYSLYNPGLPPLFWSDDAVVLKGTKQFTSVNLDNDGGDHTGEWVQIGNDPMTYKMTGLRTFEPTYWGETEAPCSITIRPPTTKKLVCYNAHDNYIQTGTVTVHYWIYHPCVFRDSDTILLPSARWLELLMMREARGTMGRRSRDPINSEIDAEWKKVVKLNPSFVVPPDPTDRIGNTFDPAMMTFRQRGRYGADNLARHTEPRDWR